MWVIGIHFASSFAPRFAFAFTRREASFSPPSGVGRNVVERHRIFSEDFIFPTLSPNWRVGILGFPKMCTFNKCRLLFRFRKCIFLHARVFDATALIRKISNILIHFIWEVGCCVHPLHLGCVRLVTSLHDAIVITFAISNVVSFQGILDVDWQVAIRTIGVIAVVVFIDFGCASIATIDTH